ncbi:hypothetical protein ACFQ36_01695 [Arthrobacter sp. GCM10027362]|uniref:hypothetical protein n=1 Tax=Arthrobacter sp. GCM10027362 TaxID=3273379 RepID=UPI00363DB9C4
MGVSEMGPLSLARLGEEHDVSRFDCARSPELNDWLKTRALTNQQRNLSRVYVLACPEQIVRAYFTLSSFVVSVGQVRSRDRGVMTQNGCAAQLLGRFARCDSIKGVDAGLALMDLAFDKYLEVVERTTSPFLCLDAKNDRLVRYYQENFGFRPSPAGASEDGSTFMYMKTSAIQTYVQSRQANESVA